MGPVNLGLAPREPEVALAGVLGGASLADRVWVRVPGRPDEADAERSAFRPVSYPIVVRTALGPTDLAGVPPILRFQREDAPALTADWFEPRPAVPPAEGH